VYHIVALPFTMIPLHGLRRVKGPSWVMGIPEMQAGIGLTPSPPIGTPYFWNAPTLKSAFPMVKKKKNEF
jgi:hypothetical protein